MSAEKYQAGDVIQMDPAETVVNTLYMIVVENRLPGRVYSAINLFEKKELDSWLSITIRADGVNGSQTGLPKDYVIAPIKPTRIAIFWIEKKIGSIPLKLLKDILAEISSVDKTQNKPTEQNNDADSDPTLSFKVGDRYTHPKLGDGTITQVKLVNNRVILAVDFGKAGHWPIDPKWVKLDLEAAKAKQKTSYERPWKNELSQLVAKITELEVNQFGYTNHGRDIQPETISVVFSEPVEGVMASLMPRVSGKLMARTSACMDRLRAELPEGFVAYVGTKRWIENKEKFSLKGASTMLETVFERASRGEKELIESVTSYINDLTQGIGVARLELAVGPGKTQFDILRLAKTSAVNYNRDTENLIRELKVLDEQVGIDIRHAAADSVSFRLLSTPEDKLAIAKELFEICPNLEDTETVEEYATKLKKLRDIGLWWS